LRVQTNKAQYASPFRLQMSRTNRISATFAGMRVNGVEGDELRWLLGTIEPEHEWEVKLQKPCFWLSVIHWPAQH
jgi:hypothetical protein